MPRWKRAIEDTESIRNFPIIMVGMGSEDDVREFAGDLDLSDPILRISRQTARQTFGIRSPHKVIDATGEEIQRFDTTEYFENLREKMVEEEK